MQYEDFYALEMEAEMREQEEVWKTIQDEMDLKMIRAWECDFQNRDFVEDLKLRKGRKW